MSAFPNNGKGAIDSRASLEEKIQRWLYCNAESRSTPLDEKHYESVSKPDSLASCLFCVERQLVESQMTSGSRDEG